MATAGTRRPWRIAAVLGFAIGCGGEPDPGPSPPHATPSTSATTTAPAAAAPPATVAAPATADDGRRILEQHGIDPERLSKDIAEQMRRRFEPRPAQ
jgi:pyruvate/2-oxoglutarate dehydrogenase complex dihydrolipoamide acyltransferase (E2) component